MSVFFNFVILLLWRGDYGVCPKSGPQLEYTSGKTLAQLGIDLCPATETAAPKKKGKAKKKHHKKKHAGKPAVVDTVDPAAAAVTDAGKVVAPAGEDVPEPRSGEQSESGA